MPIKRIGRYTVPFEVFADVVAELKVVVAPEGEELPPEQELAELEAAEQAEAEAAEAEAAEEHAEAEAKVEAVIEAEEPDETEPEADETEPESDATGPPADEG